MRARLPFVVAALLCGLVLVKGIATTSDLTWPYDVDQVRDIAFAQTIADGHALQDPFYSSEWTWYNPLLPGAVAALARATGSPVATVATRAGAYLNLAGPVCFFILLLTLFDADVALAGLAVLLFGVRGDSWQTPAYGPWLFASSFAQPFFYLALAAFVRALRTGRMAWYALAGGLLGLTFLAHAAPAVVAGLVFVAGAAWCSLTFGERAAATGRGLALALGVALVVSAPFLAAIGGHYGFHVKHASPLLWNDPAMPRDDWRPFVRMLLGRYWLGLAVVLGLAALFLDPKRRRTWLPPIAWLVASVALFVYSQFGVRAAETLGLKILPLAPPHHFLIQYQAAEVVLAALGVNFASSLAGRAGRRLSTVLLTATVLGIAVAGYPAFAARDDFNAHRRQAIRQVSPESQALIAWLRQHTAPADVFLADEESALTLVGAAGRKSVVVPTFFANPYVAWEPRKDAERAMWGALAGGDCMSFAGYARRYRVSYVLTAARRTPTLEDRPCGLASTSFSAPTVRIYKVAAPH